MLNVYPWAGIVFIPGSIFSLSCRFSKMSIAKNTAKIKLSTYVYL